MACENCCCQFDSSFAHDPGFANNLEWSKHRKFELRRFFDKWRAVSVVPGKGVNFVVILINKRKTADKDIEAKMNFAANV